MANQQFKAHCKIIDYLEKVDTEMARLIRGLCAEPSLLPSKRKPGVTFLLPQDKAFRDKLTNLAYSAKIDDVEMASNMINALIIRDCFKTPAEWKSREVSNSLYPSQVVEVDSTSAKEVTFKSGAKAVVDDGFIDSSRKKNLAVWKLTGSIPVTTDKPASSTPTSRAKRGAYEIDSLQNQTLRFKIAVSVENTYALHQSKKIYGLVGNHVDVYFNTTMSLISYILHQRKDVALVYDKILPLISCDKMDFYYLIEPHRVTGNYLIENNIISEWWEQAGRMKCNPMKVMQELERMMSNGSDALIYTDKNRLLDQIATIRQNILQLSDSRPRQISAELLKYYEELDAKNSINGVGPVFPAGLAQFYSNDRGLKAIHDELRFLTFNMFEQLETMAFDLGAYNELVQLIGDYLRAEPDQRQSVATMLSKSALSNRIYPTELVQEIKTFVYSTVFMFIPLTMNEAKNLKYKNTINRPDPSRVVLFNMAHNVLAKHHRLLGVDSGNNSDLIEMLKSLDVSTLDPELRAELAKKLGQ